jgi:hypothetical protein
VTVSDPAGVAARWREVLGVDPEAVRVEFAGGGDRGPTAIRIRGRSRSPVEIGGVRFEFA